MNIKISRPVVYATAALLLFFIPFFLLATGSETAVRPAIALDGARQAQNWQSPRGEGHALFKNDSGRVLAHNVPARRDMAPANTTVVMPFLATADADIAQLLPDYNEGDYSTVWSGYDELLQPPGGIWRALVKFDIGGLPPGAQINSATLSMAYIASYEFDAGSTPRTITTYRVSGPWTEMGVTWNTSPAFAESYGSLDLVHGNFGWVDFNVTALVAAWQAGTYANDGIMLRGPESPQTGFRSFGTRESINDPEIGVDYTPMLVVEYSVAPPTNTPVPTATDTPVPTATDTPVPTATNTAVPTSTNTPLPTSTNTSVPTSTNTPVATSTNTAVPTTTNTPVPGATNTPIPTSTDTPVPTSTNTPGSTPIPPTPTDTPVPVPTAECWQWLVNPGFESRDGWTLPITPYRAAYSMEQVYSGSWAMRTGIVNAAENVYSYSSALQTVTIPAGVDPVYLRVKLFPQSSDPSYLSLPTNPLDVLGTQASNSGDAQFVLILDRNGSEIARLISMRSNDRQWKEYEFDLTRFAGRTIKVYFSTYNSGTWGVTSMFVDEVYLTSCLKPPPTPVPTRTPAPTPTSTATPLATATPGPLDNHSFLPIIFGNYPVGISGRVTDQAGTGIAGVKIGTDKGQVTYSNHQGYYSFAMLADGNYNVTPEKAGYTFSPSSILVKIPPSAESLNFVGTQEGYP